MKKNRAQKVKCIGDSSSEEEKEDVPKENAKYE